MFSNLGFNHSNSQVHGGMTGTLTLMMELLEPSEPDKEEYDKEEERPDDLNEQPTPVPFSQGQILPEKQLELQEESHLVAILVSLSI